MDILKHINKFNEMYAGTEPAPVRYNTQQYLQGGRVKYRGAGLVDHGPEGVRQGYAEKRKSPVKINEETFKKIDTLIAEAKKAGKVLGKKGLGEGLGYKVVEKGKTSGQGGLNKVIAAWEESRDKTFEFKPSKFTANHPKVKKVIGLFENGMSKSAIAFETGISRKEIRNIFHQFAPEYIGDKNLPSGEGKNAVKNRRKKIIKELTDYWKDKPGGKKKLEEMNQKLRDIKLKNAEIINMSDEAILKNKMFEEAMNLDVKGLKAGEGINFKRYVNLTPGEYVAKVRGMAATNQFYQPEHFIAINKKNPASLLPENIYTAVGKTGGQLETMKNFVINNPNSKHTLEINKFLKTQDIPIDKIENVKLIRNQLNEGVVNFAKKIEGTPVAKQLDLKLAKKNPAKFMSRAIALGLFGELAAELAFAAPGYAAGKSVPLLLGESIFGIFGAGRTFNEELARYADPKAKEIIDLQEDMSKLQRQASTIGASEAGLEGETELQERMIPKLEKGAKSFYEREHILDDPVYGASYLKALKAKRIDEEERAKSLSRKMVGKIVETVKAPFIEGIKDVGQSPGLFKKGGTVAPDSGPMSGLPSLYNRVKKQ